MFRKLKKLFDFWSVHTPPQPAPSSGDHGREYETLPNRNCYWAKPNVLLAGEYPGCPDPAAAAERLQRCLNAGVTFFVDLTEEGEISPYADILRDLGIRRGAAYEYRRFPIVDRCTPRDREFMVMILRTVNSAIEQGHVVYVHCLGGVGRTGTVVGCWLVEQGLQGQAALDKLNVLWSRTAMAQLTQHKRSPSTDEQVAFVLAFRQSDR